MSGGAPPKRQRRYFSGKKKRHTQKAQSIVDPKTRQIVATDFTVGKTHDFALFKKERYASEVSSGSDLGYQGIQKLHPKSQLPSRKSKYHPLTRERKAHNRQLARQRILAEHIIGRLKVFRLLSERYRNRRKRFGLSFNLLAALYNFEYALLSCPVT